jgi:hypothetical protein
VGHGALRKTFSPKILGGVAAFDGGAGMRRCNRGFPTPALFSTDAKKKPEKPPWSFIIRSNPIISIKINVLNVYLSIPKKGLTFSFSL